MMAICNYSFESFPSGKYFITDAQQVSGCLWFARCWPECCVKLTGTGTHMQIPLLHKQGQLCL